MVAMEGLRRQVPRIEVIWNATVTLDTSVWDYGFIPLAVWAAGSSSQNQGPL